MTSWAPLASARDTSATSGQQQVRRIELGPESPQVSPEIGIRPGTGSLLLFDRPLAREGMELEGRERFSRVVMGDDTLAILPSEALREGERLRLTVRFADGGVPAEVWLILVVREQADALVELPHARRGSAPVRPEASALLEELERLREETARLRESHGPGGLTGLLTAAWAQGHGIATKALETAILHGVGTKDQVTLVSYRAAKRVAVEVRATFAPGTPPWSAGSAVLRDAKGRQLRVVQVWQSEPTREGAEVRIIVEAEAKESEARGTCTLELREAGGERTLMVDPLLFPDL
nr:DUF2381 family protein [Pyxidicoccus fallax]